MNVMLARFLLIISISIAIAPACTPQLAPRVTPTLQLPNNLTTQLSKPPRTFLLEPSALAAIKTKIIARVHSYVAALAKLVRDAESTTKEGSFTVISIMQTPPSSDNFAIRQSDDVNASDNFAAPAPTSGNLSSLQWVMIQIHALEARAVKAVAR